MFVGAGLALLDTGRSKLRPYSSASCDLCLLGFAALLPNLPTFDKED